MSQEQVLTQDYESRLLLEDGVDGNEAFDVERQEVQQLFDEVTNLMFRVIDRRYAVNYQTERDRQQEYDFVLAEIQRVINRQWQDIRYVQGLVETLRDSDLFDQKLAVRRAIHFIEATAPRTTSSNHPADDPVRLP